MELVTVAPLTKIKKMERKVHLRKRIMCFNCDILRLRCQLYMHPTGDVQLAVMKGRANQHKVLRVLCQNSLCRMVPAEVRIPGAAEQNRSRKVEELE